MLKTNSGSTGNLQGSENQFNAIQIKKICSTPLKKITTDFTGVYDRKAASWVKMKELLSAAKIKMPNIFPKVNVNVGTRKKLKRMG